jgi:hypothetical protein
MFISHVFPTSQAQMLSQKNAHKPKFYDREKFVTTCYIYLPFAT